MPFNKEKAAAVYQEMDYVFFELYNEIKKFGGRTTEVSSLMIMLMVMMMLMIMVITKVVLAVVIVAGTTLTMIKKSQN